MVQIPRDQEGMTGAIGSLCFWDLEFESLNLWRKDPKRQALFLEQPCSGESGFPHGVREH